MDHHPGEQPQTENDRIKERERFATADGGLGDGRVLVDSLTGPPLDRTIHDQDVHDEQDPNDRRPAGALLGGSFEATNREVTKRQHEEHQRGENSNVTPQPEGAPDRATPNRTGDERERRSERTNLCGCAGDEIPPYGALNQDHDRTNSGDDERGVGNEHHRHMHVDQSERVELANLLATGAIDTDVGSSEREREEEP